MGVESLSTSSTHISDLFLKFCVFFLCLSYLSSRASLHKFPRPVLNTESEIFESMHEGCHGDQSSESGT